MLSDWFLHFFEQDLTAFSRCLSWPLIGVGVLYVFLWLGTLSFLYPPPTLPDSRRRVALLNTSVSNWFSLIRTVDIVLTLLVILCSLYSFIFLIFCVDRVCLSVPTR